MDFAIIDKLLDLPTSAQQAVLLERLELLHADGLAEVLDVATDLLRSDPGRARRLAMLCADLAARAGAPSLVPRATYIRAQSHAINAEFAAALSLIDAARAGYEALGARVEALRTYTGRMHVLQELGRYGEALETGEYVFGLLGAAAGGAEPPPAAETSLLTAFVHQNSGLCYQQMGRFDDALAAYAAAEHAYGALRIAERVGDIHNNRGIVLMLLGRGNKAAAAFEAAAAIFAAAAFTVSHAQTLLNSGNAYVLLGDYSRALAAFDQATHLLDPLDTLADKHVLLLDMADAYLALNLYPEALAAYRDAHRLLHDAGMSHDEARALWGMGAALIALNNLQEAADMLAEAARRFTAADNVPLLASVLLEQAALPALRGERDTALELVRRALTLVAGTAWPVQRLYAHLRIADVLLPAVAQAEPYLLEAERLADRLALPQLRYRVNQRLGHLRLLQGRDAEAQHFLDLALDDIERLRGSLPHELVRTSFLHDKVSAYADLVDLYLTRGSAEDVRRGFGIAERAKSRALVDTLSHVSDPAFAGEDPALEQQIETTQAQLNAVYNAILGMTDGREGDPRPADLQPRALELEQEISRLRLRAVGASTTNAAAAPHAQQIEEPRLPADVTLLAYHFVGDEIMAFESKDGALRAIRHLSSLAVVQRLVQDLAAQWDRFRAGSVFTNRHMPLLERSAQRVLQALYGELLRPIVSQWVAVTPASPRETAIRKLIVVPHGILHQVPFHALFDGRQYILETFEISYAPSATVLALCEQRAPRHGGKALVAGVDDPSLPAVASEVRAVAEQLGAATVLLDQQATFAAIQAQAGACDVLHLACHGLFRADNPLFSALKLHDRWLLAADVMRWDLQGALVALSACESGRSRVLAGDEIIGLTRAFLGAGAATLLVSLWLVQDETTAALMATWYEQMRRMGRAAALRAAQLAVKERYAHPYYWAPFVLIGRRA